MRKSVNVMTSSYTDGLVQERRNSTANALELRLSCTNPLIQASSHLIKCTAHIEQDQLPA